MNILENANQLGISIENSKELAEFREAEEKYLNDNDLQKKVEEYKSLYCLFIDNNDEQLAKEIDLKYDILMKNDVFKNYVVSKNRFENLISTVHDLIDFHSGFENKKSKCNICNGCSKK